MRGISTLVATAVAGFGLLQGVVAEPFVVTGVPTGGTQPRYEVRDLQANHYPMWNLFLQAMEAMEAEKQGDKASYYQIAGIHGAPFIPWDGVGRTGNGGGYCPHGSNLFGPWHRPYLALIEQRAAFWARRIAAKFPAGSQRAMYVQAANNLRLPYWDWASRESRQIPLSLVQSKIEVTRPNGQKQKIKNPLASYHFHPLDSNALVQPPQNTYHDTKREPNGAGVSQNNLVESTFKNGYASIRQGVYNFFARGGHYNGVSNGGPGSAGNNIEGIHNTIHNNFGQNSHMQSPTVAAFDPIFWLHHANVDRLLAMWQHLYPATYVTSTSQPGGTFTINSGSQQDANSPLKPFHSNEAGAFWTSASARNTGAFHYTYPELAGNPSAATLRQRINKLYGSAAGVAANVASDASEARLSENFVSAPGVNVTLDIAPGDTVYSYSASITMPQSLNNDAYAVYIFMGELTEEDPIMWALDPNLVGSKASLGNPNNVDSDVVISGTIFLTQAILEKYANGELESLDRDTVVEYLNEKLYWRAQQGGQHLTPEDVPEIQVHLLSSAVETPGSEEEFPSVLDTNVIAPVNTTIIGA